MQTFLPYPDFKKSAECLDYKRLGKQRVETWQIYNVLKKIEERSELKQQILEKIAWENHPIVKMWKGYEQALLEYGTFICIEWRKKGFNDSLLPKFDKELEKFPELVGKRPSWLGSPEFHASHRSNLLRKDPKWYRQFGWKEPDNLPYVWII